MVAAARVQEARAQVGLAEQGSPEEGIAQLRQGLATWQALA